MSVVFVWLVDWLAFWVVFLYIFVCCFDVVAVILIVSWFAVVVVDLFFDLILF